MDTNILLRYAARDHQIMSAMATRLIDRIADGSERAELAPLAVFEAAFTLQTFYKQSRTEIRDLLQSILRIDALSFDRKETCIDALDIYASTNVSFADAYHVAYMRHRGIREFYSWDRGFDRFPDITRIEPT